MKTLRLVLPDGTGRSYCSESVVGVELNKLAVGDVLQKRLHDGFCGWKVHNINICSGRKYILVNY